MCARTTVVDPDPPGTEIICFSGDGAREFRFLFNLGSPVQFPIVVS